MRHHYVPQFLLRGWADSTVDSRIEVFRLDLAGLKSSRLAPKHTAYEDNLYSLTKPVVAGMEQHAVEKLCLRHIDECGARVRSKLEVDGLRTLTPRDREDWARFLMSLRIRQPDIVNNLRSESASHLRESLAADAEQYEVLAGFEDPPSLEQWVECRFPGLIENFGLSFFHALVDNVEIGNKILRMKWWIWDFSITRHDLLLADHPCIFTRGMNDPDTVIALPISPKKVFMATQSERVAKIMRRQNPSQLATRMNESSLAQARVRIYARNSQPDRFIRNRLHLRK